MEKVAVAGGTGLVGRMVVAGLERRGVEGVPLARSLGVDTASGEGLSGRLDGVDTVIDVGNVVTVKREESLAFFGHSTANLLAEGRRAGVRHHLALSIVNCDRVPIPYYAGKVEQERQVLSSGVPGTILRATQFHEFAPQVVGRGFGPLAIVPRMRTQPIAAREVAAALVELAPGEPRGLAEELAGPRQESLADMVRRYRASRGIRKLQVNLRLPGQAGKAMAGGDLLPSGPGRRGEETFEEWLARTAAEDTDGS